MAAVRAADTERDPDSTRQAVLAKFDEDGVRDTFPELDLWLERCKVWMGVRERTKATCVLTINEMRLDAFEIGRRLVEDGKLESADQIYFLTFDEFRSAARRRRRRPSIECTPDRRRRPTCCGTRSRCSRSPGRFPRSRSGPSSRTRSPTPATRTRSPAPPASPGVATGRARVVMDAYADDPTEPGEVLVAPITDPGWMPLFVGAVAVVAEMGGELEPHDDRLARLSASLPSSALWAPRR